MKKYLIALCLWCSISSNAQTIEIPLDQQIEDGQFNKSQAILPVFKFSGSTIEKYTRFGVDEKEVGTLQVSKMPDMEYTTDTAYTFIYFSGADNAMNQGYVLVMLGGYKRYRKVNTLFHIDHNNNLDFTDDGPPDTLKWNQNEFMLTMRRPDVPEAQYKIKLSRFPFGSNFRYKAMLDKHYKNHSGTKEFTSVNYCFREQRYNTKGGHYKHGNDSFTIALKDYDVNGFYNESCADMYYVGPYKHEVNIDNLMDIVPNVGKTAFEWNEKKYVLKSIDPLGKSITIERNDNAVLTNKLEEGKKVPKFTFKSTTREEIKLKHFKKAPVFLYFWEEESLTEEDTVYLNKIHNELADKIQLVTLNHGDKPKNVLIFQFYDKIKWPIGFSTSSISELYFVEEVNRGFYIDKGLKLINDRITPKELYDRLK